MGGYKYGGDSSGGAALLFDGDLEGAWGYEVASLATALLWGTYDPKTALSDYAGNAIEHGDFDGDGMTDLVVGAMNHPIGSVGNFGAACVVLGPVTGERYLADADSTWEGEVENDSAGGVLESGDLDGDGHSDLAIGGYMSGRTAPGAGGAWVLIGLDAGIHSLTEADIHVESNELENWLGTGLAMRDWGGTAVVGLAVGAFGTSGETPFEGAAYVWDELSPGTVTTADAPTTLTGEESEGAGVSLAAGDSDGDGNGNGNGDGDGDGERDGNEHERPPSGPRPAQAERQG